MDTLPGHAVPSNSRPGAHGVARPTFVESTSARRVKGSPEWTAQNSPPFQRWVVMSKGLKPREGRQSRASKTFSFVPEGTYPGTRENPAMNRWAMIFRPAGLRNAPLPLPLHADTDVSDFGFWASPKPRGPLAGTRKKFETTRKQAARSADWQSAVSPSGTRRNAGNVEPARIYAAGAECHSAIQQINNLRYIADGARD